MSYHPVFAVILMINPSKILAPKKNLQPSSTTVKYQRLSCPGEPLKS